MWLWWKNKLTCKCVSGLKQAGALCGTKRNMAENLLRFSVFCVIIIAYIANQLEIDSVVFIPLGVPAKRVLYIGGDRKHKPVVILR